MSLAAGAADALPTDCQQLGPSWPTASRLATRRGLIIVLTKACHWATQTNPLHSLSLHLRSSSAVYIYIFLVVFFRQGFTPNRIYIPLVRCPLEALTIRSTVAFITIAIINGASGTLVTEVLRYESEGRDFTNPMNSLDSLNSSTFPAALGPGVYSASNRNE
jgi:hypothetical protein